MSPSLLHQNKNSLQILYGYIFRDVGQTNRESKDLNNTKCSLGMHYYYASTHRYYTI